MLYNTIGEYQKGLGLIKKPYYFFIEKKDSSNALLALNNWAYMLEQSGKIIESRNKYKEGLKLCGNSSTSKATICNNLGHSYMLSRNFDSSLFYYGIALENAESFSFDHQAMLQTNLANVYSLQKNWKNMELHLAIAESLAMKNKLMPTLKTIFTVFSICYERKNDFQLALKYYKKFKKASDSLNREMSQKNINELQVKYELKQKDIELQNQSILIEKQKSEQERKNYFLLLLISFLGFLIVIVFFIVRAYRNKQKNNLYLSQLNRELIHSKQELEKQKHIISRQKEAVDKAFESLTEKNKEVLDSITYAKRIQKALFTPEIYVLKSLIRLKNKNTLD
jgi:hypothetical protein